MHTLSVVVPVYRGAPTLPGVIAELAPLVLPQLSPGGRRFRLAEVLLVHDGAVDDSARVLDALAAQHAFVTPIWLSRNYGQHPATLAGMSSSSAGWVVTMDEDGQHHPRYLGALLDRALDEKAQLVYAVPANQPPHGLLRNAASGLAKTLFVSGRDTARLGRFSSYRLIWGEIARSVAAYCGSGVYLDVALSWVVGRAAALPVDLRGGTGRPSGYDLPKLLGHFWRLVLTSGTRPLRAIALLGGAAVLLALALSGYAVWEKLTHQVPIAGWTSSIIALCFFAGAILFSLGIIAEYLAFAVHMAMGKPAYLIVSRPGPPNAGK